MHAKLASNCNEQFALASPRRRNDPALSSIRIQIHSLPGASSPIFTPLIGCQKPLDQHTPTSLPTRLSSAIKNRWTSTDSFMHY